MARFTILISAPQDSNHLEKCLSSLRPPHDDYDLFVVGRDGSREEIFRKLSPEWLFLLSGDAYLSAKYWDHVLPLLDNPHIDSIGGPLIASKDSSVMQTVTAITLASPFCSGANFARYHVLGKKMFPTDETRLSDENRWIRLKAQHHNYFYHPLLIVYYFHRVGLKEFFIRGVNRSKLNKTEAHYLPSIFVLMHLLVLFSPQVALYLAKLYGTTILFISLGLSFQKKKFYLFPLVAIMHYLIVISYGLGFLAHRLKIKKEVL